MRIHKQFFKSIALMTMLSTGFAAHGIAQDKTTIDNPETKVPAILTTSPSSGAMNVELGSVIEITFSVDMDENTLNGSTLLLHASKADSMQEEQNKVMTDDQIRDRTTKKDSENNWKNTTSAISGTISYSNKVAVFTPDEELKEGTMYTFTVSSAVKSVDNVSIENDQTWNFTTTDTPDTAYLDNQNERSDMSDMVEEEDMDMQMDMENENQYENRSMYASSANESKIVDLGKAGEFVILAKKDVNNESGSNITGRVGMGSEANTIERENDDSQSNMDQNMDQNSAMRSDQSDTSSANVTEAIKDMETAFSDVSEYQPEDLTTHNTQSFHHNPTLEPGVHEWDSSIQIISDVTLSGNADDVWIFKTDSDLTVFENTVITLADGASAENVYWYVEGEASIGKNAEFEGIILSMNDITLENGAVLNGRIFSQASITLDSNTITEPKDKTTLSTISRDEEDKK